MPSLWEWVYLGQVASDMAGDAAREAAAARKNLNTYEDTLVEMATLSAQKWAVLEDMLLLIKDTDFGDETVRNLRQDARSSRLEAMGELARHQVGDPIEGRYKPLWDIFREMADAEMRLYDEIIEACDDRTLEKLDHALATARLCVSLGEQAIQMMPAITAARLQEEKRQEEANKQSTKNWLMGCGVAAAVGFLLVVGCAIAIT